MRSYFHIERLLIEFGVGERKSKEIIELARNGDVFARRWIFAIFSFERKPCLKFIKGFKTANDNLRLVQ